MALETHCQMPFRKCVSVHIPIRKCLSPAITSEGARSEHQDREIAEATASKTSEGCGILSRAIILKSVCDFSHQSMSVPWGMC